MSRGAIARLGKLLTPKELIAANVVLTGRGDRVVGARTCCPRGRARRARLHARPPARDRVALEHLGANAGVDPLEGRKHLAQAPFLDLEDAHGLLADPLEGEDAAVAKKDDEIDLVGGVAEADIHELAATTPARCLASLY